MQTMNLFFNAVMQVILFSIIPLIWWVVNGRKQSTFFNWLGIKKPIIADRKKFVSSFLLTILLLLIPAFLIVPLFVNSSDMATSKFLGQGISALIPALIYSFLQTGFSEELFFRGFLTKRLINQFGFKIGNIVQSLLFGLMHGLLFISLTGLIGSIIIIVITGLTGWLMGWINEKQSNGSIISSWLLHGCANTIASVIAMFDLL